MKARLTPEERQRRKVERGKRWLEANRDKHNARRRLWRVENNELAREREREWRLQHLEREQARKRAYRWKHRDKRNAKLRDFYQEHREHYIAEVRKYRMLNTDKIHAANLEARYGPGAPEHYRKMLIEQGGTCAICGCRTKKRLSQDHSTACCPYPQKGKLKACGQCRRGLLCNHCNRVLSSIERPGWLRKALRYLRRWDNTKPRQLAPIVDLVAKLKRDLELLSLGARKR